MADVIVDELRIGFHGIQPAGMVGWRFALKRVADVVVAGLALLVLSPLFAAIACLIRLESRGSPFFKQVRIGWLGKPFVLYKFRSMRAAAEELQHALRDRNEATGPVFKLRNDPRMTRVGRTLRRLSLDELPQLINVVKGDMSLIGPRPPLPSEVKLYTDRQMRRLSVPQGLTGLWQVSGRSDIPFEHWVELDLWYIEHQSLTLDLKILLRTIPAVVLGRGAY